MKIKMKTSTVEDEDEDVEWMLLVRMDGSDGSYFQLC